MNGSGETRCRIEIIKKEINRLEDEGLVGLDWLGNWPSVSESVTGNCTIYLPNRKVSGVSKSPSVD